MFCFLFPLFPLSSCKKHHLNGVHHPEVSYGSLTKPRPLCRTFWRPTRTWREAEIRPFRSWRLKGQADGRCAEMHSEDVTARGSTFLGVNWELLTWRSKNVAFCSSSHWYYYWKARTHESIIEYHRMCSPFPGPTPRNTPNQSYDRLIWTKKTTRDNTILSSIIKWYSGILIYIYIHMIRRCTCI